MIFKDFKPESLAVLPEPPQSIRKPCHLCLMQSVSVPIFLVGFVFSDGSIIFTQYG